MSAAGFADVLRQRREAAIKRPARRAPWETFTPPDQAPVEARPAYHARALPVSQERLDSMTDTEKWAWLTACCEQETAARMQTRLEGHQ